MGRRNPEMLAELVYHLKINDYDVTVHNNHIVVRGNKVKGYIYYKPPLNDKVRLFHTIFFDHEECFDKIARPETKCPLSISLPTSNEQIKFLLEKIKWVGSQDGLITSELWHTEKWITEYPRNLKINSLLENL